MKPETISRRSSGFNSLDLLVMLMAVAVVAMVLLPMIAKSRALPSRINCANNLKQIVVSVWMWSDDNGGRPPAQVPTNEGGAKELVEAGSVAGYFQVMSNELGTPKIVACPDDPAHRPARDFGYLHATNIGYFVVPEADGTITNLWLAGDRNLATNNVVLKPGLFTMPLNGAVRWTAQQHITYGNLVYADGRVEQPTNARLQASAINALLAYRLTTTNKSFRIAIP